MGERTVVPVTWHEHDFVVGMPLMAPGERLSEVELLKVIALYQWEAIAAMLGQPPSRIENEVGERLYGSVVSCELHLGRHSMESLGEDVHVRVRNRVATFGGRFVEGLLVFDDAPIADAALADVDGPAALARVDAPWAYITNAFVARGGSNTSLKVFKPVGMDDAAAPRLADTPPGVVEQRRSLETGAVDGVGDDASLRPVPVRSDEPIDYVIVPESDLNGAGLVYFARFVSMMSYGERILLGRRLARPLSSALIACLSTEHRKIFYFGNAAPDDTIGVYVTARCAAVTGAKTTGQHRTPCRFVFRHDLYRRSDGALIASSVVQKALVVSAKERGILLEAERFLATLR